MTIASSMVRPIVPSADRVLRVRPRGDLLRGVIRPVLGPGNDPDPQAPFAVVRATARRERIVLQFEPGVTPPLALAEQFEQLRLSAGTDLRLQFREGLHVRAAAPWTLS